ncbi:MAG TPA: hypothetical protein PKA55_19180 [Rhodoblastus sp.]|nr:hypothetical protein [Rhodoblastus sp.]
MKKAIDWCALVVGLALALFGARWMWIGWDIVQAERGWAALIAGSVMLSGGLIVATLAWTIMRLTGMASPARRAPSVEDAAPPPVSRSPLAAPAAAGAIVAAGATAVAATLPTPADEDRDEASAEPDVDDLLPSAPRDEELSPAPPPPPVAPPTVGELLRMSEDRAARESHEKTFEAPEAKIEAPLAAPAAESIVEDEAEKPVEEASAAPPEPPPAEPVAVAASPPQPLRIPEPPPPPVAKDELVYDDWLERTARELGRDAAPKEEAPPPEPPPPPPKAEPAVVGRYSSGDTNYLMFADGSIEAQTPDGVMRFASLTELKRFVEKRN